MPFRKFNVVVLLLTMTLMLSACNTLQQMKTREIMTDFQEVFRLYSKHLRWGHFRELTTLMTPSQLGPALEKIDSLKDRRISKVKSIKWDLDEENKVLVGPVVIEYYLSDRGIIRTTTQQQTWRLIGDNWKLDTGLPDLP